MNKIGKYLLTFGILLPLTVFASGGYILEWVWIEFFVLAAFILTLVLVKINWIGKALMILTFIVTTFLTMGLTEKFPYLENRVMINVISIVAPTLTTFISYWILRVKFKKKINS